MTIPPGRFRQIKLKYRRVRHPLNELIPLAQYAAENFLSMSGARDRIDKGKVIAYKIQGKWYVWLP